MRRPVAVPQAHPVDALGAADVGRAVAPERDGLVGRQPAGHARDPQHLVAEFLHRPVAELVDLGQFGDAIGRARVHAGDELELRFAEIGGDERVRQGRAQRGGMRCQRQAGIRQRAQAFLLDPPSHVAQPRVGQFAQAFVQTAHAASPQYFLGADGTRPWVWLPVSGHDARRGGPAPAREGDFRRPVAEAMDSPPSAVLAYADNNFQETTRCFKNTCWPASASS